MTNKMQGPVKKAKLGKMGKISETSDPHSSSKFVIKRFKDVLEKNSKKKFEKKRPNLLKSE